MNHGTPARKDKRLWACLAVMSAVIGLRLRGVQLSFDELMFFASMTAFYCGQSQWGLVKRAGLAQEPPK